MSHVQTPTSRLPDLSIFDQQSVCPVCYLFVEERQNTHGAEAEENLQQIRSGVHEIRSPILAA
jgi:hypothetical protein